MPTRCWRERSSAEQIRADLRLRHPGAYAPRALTRREHAEAPRFGLVRCERGDVLLTASCDLTPEVIAMKDFAGAIRASGGGWWPVAERVPPITILTTNCALDWLVEHRLLPGVLLRLQAELRRKAVVGLRIAGTPIRRRSSS